MARHIIGNQHVEVAKTIKESILNNVYSVHKSNKTSAYANDVDANSVFLNCYEVNSDGNMVKYPDNNQNSYVNSNRVVISTVQDWNDIADNVNSGRNTYEGKTIVLSNDLDFGNENFISIAKSNTFKGNFDGNGYVIKNISSTTENGLFGKVENSIIENVISLDNNFKLTNAQYCGLIQEGYSSIIKNIAVKGNSIITDGINCESYGAVIGYAEDSVITNCVNERNYEPYSCSFNNAAGIVGKGNNSQISNCRNEGAFTVTQSQGNLAGIVGTMTNGGIIESCYNTGSLTSRAGHYVAGIVSGNLDGGIVKYCFNTGEIRSNLGSFGIIYTAYPSNNQKGSKIVSCYNSGYLNGSRCACGILDRANYVNIINCYNFGNIEYSGNASGIGYQTDYSKLINCYNFGNIGDSTTIRSGMSSGILFTAKQTVIEECTNYGKISSYYGASGILYYADSNESCTIIDCNNNGEIYVKDSGICAGIVGTGSKSTIERCFNNGIINGAPRCSGIAGQMDDGKVIQCYNLGTFSTGNIGGCVFTSNGCVINHCYNLADIKYGGAVGGILQTGRADITYCSNYGTLGNGGVGGIAYSNNGKIEKCNNYGKINASSGAGIVYYLGNAIIDCHNFNTIKGSGIGGIVYSNSGSIIMDCSNEGDLEGAAVAGIVYTCNSNYNWVRNCYNSGNIESSGSGCGITCSTNAGDYIVNCYNEGSIHAYGSASGIGGRNIENCYNKGPVSSGYGITSYNNANTKNCYYSYNATPEGCFNKQDVAGQCERITEEQLQSASFVKKLNNNRSEFTTTPGILAPWKYNENSNPTLDTKRLRANPATVVNRHKAELVITKVDADNTNKKLAGAEFKIEQVNDEVIDLLTDENMKKGSYTYQFVKNGNVYESNNAGQSNQKAASYIPIDLTDTRDVCELTVNASISSYAGDIGYATVTDGIGTPHYSVTTGRFIIISGEVQATDYKINLTGGKVYYLHLVYDKGGNENSGSDKFTINSVTIKKPYKDYMIVTTNNNGTVSVPLPNTEKVRITEIIAPKGYELTDYIQEIETNDENINLTVKNEKENPSARFTINKADEDGNPLKDAKYEIYKVNADGEKIDFAKARNGQYAGTYENEKHTFKTDEQGKIVVVLQEGLYKAVEVEAPEGYALESDEELRSIYFEIEDEVKLPDFSGTEVLISTPEDLQTVANNVNNGIDDYAGKTLKLANNINMSGYTIKIGENNIFRGNFDGNEKTISNLNKYLFGNVENANIGNVILDSPKFGATNGIDEVSFIGNAFESNLYNIKIEGTGYSLGGGPGGGSNRNAGIVGYVKNSIVNNCSSSAPVSASSGNAGSVLIHTAINSKIANCSNAGTLSVNNGGSLSGIVYKADNSKVINCINTGSKSATYAGMPQGIVNTSTNNTIIKKCYDNDVEVTGKIYTIFGTQLDLKEKTVVNKKYRNLTINKIDADTNEPISSAEFEVLATVTNGFDNKQQELYKTIVIGEDGSATVEITKDGTYTVKETKATQGYKLEEYTEVINPGDEDVQLTVANRKDVNPQRFTINKTDENGNVLSGAKFEIYKIQENGEIIDFAKDTSGRYVGVNEDEKYRCTTNELGEINVYLEEGLYEAIEVEAPVGYAVHSNGEIYFEVSNNQAEQQNVDLEISTIEDLIRFSNSVNGGNTYAGKYVKLMNDLDFTNDASYENPLDSASFGDYNNDGTTESIKEELSKSQGFKPIGGTNSFRGVFDGNDKQIKGLYINSTSLDYVGLFGKIDGATIKNVSVSGTINVTRANSSINFTAGVVGCATNNSRIYNCTNHANVSVNNNNRIYAGGICGRVDDTIITNCYNDGNISYTTSNQNSYAGGISAYIWSSSIEKCDNKGNISGTSTTSSYWAIAGGITGYSGENSYINKVFNEGNVAVTAKGSSASGGIVGADYAPNKGVNNAYNTGEISGNATGNYSKYIGGIIGNTSVQDCVKNSANFGKLKSIDSTTAYAGGIVGYASLSVNMKNIINVNNIEVQSGSRGGIVGYSNNLGTCENVYNNYTATFGNNSSYTGGSCKLTDEQFKSEEFLKLLNTETDGLPWIHNADNYPILDFSNIMDRYNPVNGEFTVKNIKKAYKITTTVEKNSEGSATGGNISGRDMFIYEVVEHGNNSTKSIIITPDEGYIIDKITINGESISFNTDENGNYTLPQFNEMNENKEIAVTFIKDGKYNFILNKTNDEGEKLQGVKFCIYDEQGDFAKDYSGNYVGVKETIDDEEKYIVTTDKNGQVKLKLRKGRYKVVEVETLEGYWLDTEEREFENNDESVRLNWQGGFVYQGYPYNQYLYPTNDGGMIETFGGSNATISADKMLDNQTKQISSDKGVILKYNNQGKIEKVVQFTGFQSGSIVYQDSDNNFVVLGWGRQLEIPAESTVDNRAISLPYSETSYRTIILKLDSNLKVIYAKAIESFYPSLYNSNYMNENKAGNYIINIRGYSTTENGVITIPGEMTVDNQQIQFTKSMGGMLVEMTKGGKFKNVKQYDYNTSNFVENSNGGYVMATDNNSPIAVKLDSNLNIEDTLTNNTGLSMRSSYATQDGGVITTATVNGNVIITGDNTASGEDIEINSSELPDVAFIKYNKDFKIEWVKVKSFASAGINEYAQYIKQDSRGNYYVQINENNKYKWIKLDSEMNILEVIETAAQYMYPNSDLSHFVLCNYQDSRWEDWSFGSDTTTTTTISVINHLKGKIIVHHYKKGTGPEFGNEPIQLADDETSENLLGSSYTTAQKTDIEGYRLITDEFGDGIITENANGQYTLEPQEIFYYYETVDEHKITSQVEIPEGRTEKGGKVTGDITINPDSVIEELDNNKTSTKDILIEPDTGYRVKEVRLVSTDSEGNKKETIIYGEDADVDAEVKARMMKDGKMMLTKFTNVKEDKHIIVVFEPNEGTVVVHHYVENTTEKLSKDEVTTDLLGTVVETNQVNKGRYVLVSGPEGEEKTPTIDTTLQQRTYYYQLEYNITTDVIEHDELYADKDVDGNIVEREEKNQKGGAISGEDEQPYEAVLRYRDNTKKIEITPSEGYEIVGVTINDEVFDYKNSSDTNDKVTLGEDGKLTLDEAFFTSMEEDKDIKVSFKKKSKVIVKYLEEETGNVLYKTPDDKDCIEIVGVEGDNFTTEHKIIPGYKDSTLGITDEDGIDVTNYSRVQIESNSAEGTMYANEITIIYWYKRIESKAIERHIEINEKGEATELANREFDGYALDVQNTYRMNFGEKYIPVDGPANTNDRVTVVGKDEESKEVTLAEEGTNEVWYYYEKQFNVTTEVKPHDETVIDVSTGEEKTVKVDGGTISKEYKTDENGEFVLDEDGNKIEVPYELILNRADSTKEIVIKPDELYRIKSITINDEVINLESFTKAEDGSITLPEKYFEDVKEDKHIVVEFEKIPAKVIVKYVDVVTGEEILEEKVIEGYIKDDYNEPRVEVDGYIPADPEPDNSQGKMTEDVITVIYYYNKQFIITTDVIEHEEDENRSTVVDVVVKDNEEDNNSFEQPTEKKITVKGGSITGELTEENNEPVEIVLRGKDSTKQIIMKPEAGYRIKSIIVHEGDRNAEGDYTGETYELDIEELTNEDGTVVIPEKYFKDMQSNKHIEVEYERIPGKVIVNYLEKDSNEVVDKQESGNGYVGDEYKTYEKEIPYYELLKDELPSNAEGTIAEEDTVVNYWYRRFLFNMKLTKEFTSVQVNGVEKLGKDNKLVKVDIKNSDIENTNITVKYKITVTNTEEIAGTAIVCELIPEGFKFINAEQDGWELKDGRYELITKLLEPGEVVEYEVTLEWDNNAKYFGTAENIATIIGTENIPNFDETTKADNEDLCTLIISVRTGESTTIAGLTVAVLIGFAGVCVCVYARKRVHVKE